MKNDSIAAFATSSLGTGAFTIELWMKPILNSGTNQGFLGIGPGGDGIALFRTNTAQSYQFAFRTSGGAYYQYGNMPTSYNGSGWYHLVVQRRGSDNQMQIWVNGVATSNLFGYTNTQTWNQFQFGRIFPGNPGDAALIGTLMTGIRISNIARYPMNENGSAPDIIVRPIEVVQDSNTLAAFNFRFNTTDAQTLTTYLTSEDGTITLGNSGNNFGFNKNSLP